MIDHRERLGRIAASLSMLLLVAVPSAQAVVVNRILATIDGQPLTLFELQRFTQSTPPMARTAEPQAMLDALLTSRLIELEIEKKGIVVSDAEIDNYINQIRQQNQITEEQLSQALAAQGLTREAYRVQIRQELERAQLINREIRGKVNVTPEEVERYYEAHREEYAKDPEVTISHIVLRVTEDAPPDEVERVEQRAQEIHAELDRGKDFAETARQYSEDPAAESGGSLGTFRVGTMLEALDEAARDLDVGEYSEPVRSSVGFHIVRLDARSAESHTPLDEVSDQIREKLYNEALEARYTRWLSEDLRQRHHVEMLE